jgi:hypothetical protein
MFTRSLWNSDEHTYAIPGQNSSYIGEAGGRCLTSLLLFLSSGMGKSRCSFRPLSTFVNSRPHRYRWNTYLSLSAIEEYCLASCLLGIVGVIVDTVSLDVGKRNGWLTEGISWILRRDDGL